MGAVAFFDLDRTLLACNSATAWLREEVRTRHVRALDALKVVAWLARYSLGASNMEDAVLATIAGMKGRDERDIETRTAEFFRREIRPKVRPGGRAAMAEHRRRGDELVLLTSSSRYLSGLVAKDLELDAFLCTLLEVDERGFFTGRPLGRPCFGGGKLEKARNYVEARGLALADGAFYTDSASDLPVLAEVGRPVAVNPDPRLARIARARRWPIVDWGKPALVPAQDRAAASSGGSS